ncbi:MAG: hypothetical protein K2X03_20990 [Bryobacteraceae bacterium]|nr:hypothetical protein [Bryobacteraceae bacterium]
MAQAGQFRHGLGRGDSLKAKIPVAPAVRIGRATLSIEATNTSAPAVPAPGSTADPSPPVAQIQAALDQVFRESFNIVQSNGEAALRVSVTFYSPAESRVDPVTQKSRVPAAPNPDGSPQIDPQTGQPLTVEKSMVIEQWTARGQIALRVEVVDNSGVLIDTFTPQATVKGSEVISVDGQDRVDRTQLPTNDQVRAKLIADLVAQFAPRYCPPAAELEIPLAVDEGLRPGNKLAQTGDFASASKSWESATLKKEEGEGDRLHNIGTVYEAQGYGTLLKQADPNQAEPYFARAIKQYAAAAEVDPKEKYITRAADRARKAMMLVEAFRDLEKRRQQALAAKSMPSTNTGAGVVVTAPPPPPPPAAPPTPGGFFTPQNAATPVDPVAQEALTAALNDPRPDSTQETAFRDLIRLRLRANPGVPTDEAKAQLESTGPMAYSLTALQAKRVVHQESRDWMAVQPKLSVYRETFTAFAQDGKINPSERQALLTLAKNLGLLEADVKLIESSLKVAE